MKTLPKDPPERTATAAELADAAAHIERARSGQPLPRTLHALIEQGPRLLACGRCATGPGTPCTRSGGYHLMRFQDAERRGLITRASRRARAAGARHVNPGRLTAARWHSWPP